MLLEHDRAVETRPFHPLPIDPNVAVIISVEAEDEPQRGGFAATRGSHDADKLGLVDCKMDMRQRLDLMAGDTEPLAGVSNLQSMALATSPFGDGDRAAHGNFQRREDHPTPPRRRPHSSKPCGTGAGPRSCARRYCKQQELGPPSRSKRGSARN